MVIDNIDNTLHPFIVNGVDQIFKILHCSILRVYFAKVLVGIRTAKLALSCLHTDRMDRHKPDDVHTQLFDAIQVFFDRPEGSFLTMITNVNRIHYLVAQHFLCSFCHQAHSLFLNVYSILIITLHDSCIT
ncbi:hypothetical protein D3C78_1165210 [compost metagenome]